MSQILVTSNQAIIQDIVISKNKPPVSSSASFAKCYVCGKGLEDGFSLIAKSTSSRIALFCDIHY